VNSRPRVRWHFLILLAVVAFARSAAAQPSAPPAAAPSYDSVLDRAAKATGPGVAAIVVKDGKVVYREARGLANVEKKVPLTPDSVFRLGSVTKQFTSMAVMMLVEQGKIGLRDPIDKYLPGYPQGQTITVEHLLTHTSGIQSYTDIPGYMTSKVQADLTVAQLIDAFKNEPMPFAPGTRYRYNNSGYVLLGAIIEKASGQTYAAFIADHIFKPLGMSHSYYGTDEPKVARFANGYTAGDKPARPLSMTQPYAAGSLLSTVDDLVLWDAALYTEKLVKRSSLDLMWTPHELNDGSPTGYGFGWEMSTLRGHRTVEHGGGIFGFSTYVLRMPEDRVYVAVLCNTDSPSAPPASLAKRLGAIAVGNPMPELTEVKVDPKVYDAYVGEYELAPGFILTVTREGDHLITQATGQSKIEVFPSSETDFFLKVTDAQLTFVKGPTGAVDQVVLHQNGRDIPAKRKK
jgi:D-alanyl-D-alanine carboxypeptidase